MLYFLGMVGISAFAITSVISSGKKDMDLFSIVLLGMVASLGGGTIRDVILSVDTVYWVQDTSYLWVAIASSVFAFLMVRHIENREQVFNYADSFGLALFTVVATEKVLTYGFSPSIAITMGVITGVAGGMIRDVLSHRPPMVLGKEFYATPALLGAGLVVGLLHLEVAQDLSAIVSVIFIFTLRVLAIQHGLYYPKWLLYRKR